MNTAPFGYAIVDKDGEFTSIPGRVFKDLPSANSYIRNMDDSFSTFAPHRLVELYTKEQIEPILRGLMRGDCFCEMAIGNPMCKSHDTGCKAATAFLHNIVEPESNGDADTEVELSQPTIDKFTTLIKSIAKSKGES